MLALIRSRITLPFIVCELGGYETWLGTNRVEPEASEKITARALELLQQERTSP